uniref:Uncharacterized protein n=1 Tax=Timema cristinae TaxID=61476 RepID=A0A7R9DDY9_TIMCR|nr:unnamed protein product [Timema cristinae]
MTTYLIITNPPIHSQPANWPDPVPSLLVLALPSLLSLTCTRPGFRWDVTQPTLSYSDPGVHHLTEMAHQLERGLANKPITVKWLGESTHSSTSLPDKKIVEMFPSGNNPVVSDSTFPSFSFNSSNVEGPIKMPTENRDFENLVLHRMRQAEEHRKLAQKIKNEEG